jgi:hypothetical protein
MATVLVAIGVFALAVLGLSIGVVLRKRTPLKGSCKAAATDGACESCACHPDRTGHGDPPGAGLTGPPPRSDRARPA